MPLIAAMCVPLAGCVVDAQPGAGGVRGGGGAGASAWGGDGPFAPQGLRVHPLTHIDAAGGGGGGVLMLHMELRDQWGDSVKGVGTLVVELFRPAGASAGAAGGGWASEPALRWEVEDMNDPAQSSRRFDPPTRTYRVPLQTPAWAARWVRDDSVRNGLLARLRVRAALVSTGVDGQRRVIQDEFVIEGG